MKPKIIMHTQISLDGRIKGFDNPEVYYQVAGGIHSDAVLFGSNTVFTAFEKYPAETEADFEKIITSPEDPRPIGVIPDSRGILRSLHCLRNLGYLKEIVILVSTATPKEYLNYLEERHYPYIVSGNDHVDYEKAFQILHEQYGCKYMRTDSGGGLTNKLLENGLIDEIS
ncbi:TPA: dihydrofolate reductase family protein, partial [Staphylococcus pseudintermedius]|nr:dihydrofolate reductase family protein [Staphylococcus aureus]